MKEDFFEIGGHSLIGGADDGESEGGIWGRDRVEERI